MCSLTIECVLLLKKEEEPLDDAEAVYTIKGPTITFICVDDSDKAEKTVRIEHEVPVP